MIWSPNRRGCGTLDLQMQWFGLLSSDVFEGRNRPRLAGAVVVTDGLVVTCLSCTKVDLLLYAQ
jgi:hypothetical protein